jgi:hypothetical protein
MQPEWRNLISERTEFIRRFRLLDFLQSIRDTAINRCIGDPGTGPNGFLSHDPSELHKIMAEERKKPSSFVTQYLERKAPEMAELHDAWAVESSFNESELKYKAKEKHEYVYFPKFTKKRIEVLQLTS